MKRRMRIQVKARWAEEEVRVRIHPPTPVPQAFKMLAVLGILLFWCYYLGWFGRGGQDGLETGFLLFGICQMPMLWWWVRGQMRRWH
ncbi:hypothetical protein [Chitinimonas sp. JJ19]|uniref:hypothetical protein n=1 Tax=Chitinimonas sp. JJ19 TaxID=3109352 RepID=UPI003000D104